MVRADPGGAKMCVHLQHERERSFTWPSELRSSGVTLRCFLRATKRRRSYTGCVSVSPPSVVPREVAIADSSPSAGALPRFRCATTSFRAVLRPALRGAGHVRAGHGNARNAVRCQLLPHPPEPTRMPVSHHRRGDEPPAVSCPLTPRAAQPGGTGRRQRCAATYASVTCLGSRPRTPTSNPAATAHARTAEGEAETAPAEATVT